MSWKVWKQPIERAQEEFDNGYKRGSTSPTGTQPTIHSVKLLNSIPKQAILDSANVAKALASFLRALSDPQRIENWADTAAALLN